MVAPRLPDTVRVRVGPLYDQEWRVDNVGECRQCAATIFWCITLNNNRAPVDAEPDDEGLHTAHHATCPAVEPFKRPRRKPRASGRDRAAGER